MDLLTVLRQEVGHVLGYDHDEPRHDPGAWSRPGHRAASARPEPTSDLCPGSLAASVAGGGGLGGRAPAEDRIPKAGSTPPAAGPVAKRSRSYVRSQPAESSTGTSVASTRLSLTRAAPAAGTGHRRD